MGYSAETTHFGIPLPTGSDLTTPMDYNESAQAVDTALFESQASSDTALQKAIAVETGLAGTNTEVANVKGRVTTLEQTSQTQGTAITNLGNKVDDVKADALDMICAVDEGTAQIATVAVSEGDYFRYNDVLYVATDDIAIGDTIVPNTNCRATNVATELQNGGGSSAVDSVARAGVEANNNKIGTLAQLDTTDKSSLVNAINEVLSQIGGGSMPVLDYGSPAFTFSTNALSHTAVDGEFLHVASITAIGNNPNNVKIDGVPVSHIFDTSGNQSAFTGTLKLKAGQVVTLDEYHEGQDLVYILVEA